jgi:hypothetical protein
VRASRHRFSTSGPKNHRGTVVTFRLRAPARVVFVVHGPSPSCGVVGKKSVRGRSGVNRVRLNGRFGDHTLGPGTYEIVVVAQRGKAHRRVGKISIQVVPPGSRVRRSGAPRFRCTAPAAQTGIPGSGVFLSPPSKDRGSRSQGAPTPGANEKSKPTGRSGVLAEPPFHIGTGNGGVDMLLALLLYGTLGVGGAVLLVYLVRILRGSSTRAA